MAVLRVGYVQVRPRFGQVGANLEQAGQLVERAPEFDLLALPELFSTGYLFADRAELLRFAETSDGPTVSAMQRWARARSGWIVGGYAEKEGERVYNAAALVGPQGRVRVYRKVHLFDRETLLFQAGERPFEAWEISTGSGRVRVGVMICFDWFFPEAARSLALDGAEVILHPSNLVLPHAPEAMRTRCLENRVFAVTANRIGMEERAGLRLQFTGCSQVAGPDGELVARAGRAEECVAVVEVALPRARAKRVTERNDLWRDRRPECYARLGGAGGV